MARRVFFSFHYDRDVSRAEIVRNSWCTHPDRESAGFIDSVEREKVMRGGDAAIRRFIQDGLNGVSVTAVLIGAQTSQRAWVNYEIEESRKARKGIIGIYIHKLKDFSGATDHKGANPLAFHRAWHNGCIVPYSEIYCTYDWCDDDGYHNLGAWVEAAAKAAGR